MDDEQPLEVRCAGDKWWTIPLEQVRELVAWYDRAANEALQAAARHGRGKGRPPTDWWALLRRLLSALERGEPFEATLDGLRKRYGIQSLEQAKYWVKKQRQASEARLQELRPPEPTDLLGREEWGLHDDVRRLLPKRRAGRPRKSG